MDLWSVLFDILVLLVTALVLGVACERLRQSAVLGYLAAGRAPFGRDVEHDQLVLMREVVEIHHLQELVLPDESRQRVTNPGTSAETGILDVGLVPVVGPVPLVDATRFIQRVSALEELIAVSIGVAIGVKKGWIEAQIDLFTIGEPVAIAVGNIAIGANTVLPSIRQPISIGVKNAGRSERQESYDRQ